MSEGRKKPLEIGIQMPETKIPVQSTTTIGPLVPVSGDRNQKLSRKADAAHALLRLVCLLSSVAALSVMVTAEQSATISLYGFELPLYSKWSLSDSLEFLVGMSAAVAAHSLLQLVLSTAKLLKKSPVIVSRKHAWIIFAGDQGRYRRQTVSVVFLLLSIPDPNAKFHNTPDSQINELISQLGIYSKVLNSKGSGICNDERRISFCRGGKPEPHWDPTLGFAGLL